MKTFELKQKRKECEAAISKAVSDSDTAKLAELRKEHAKFGELIEGAELVEKAEASETRSATQTTIGDGKEERAAIEGFSLLRAIEGARAAAKGEKCDVDDGREREVAQEIRKRRPDKEFKGIAIPTEALEKRVTTTTTSANVENSGILQTVNRTDLMLPKLRDSLVLRRVGARILTGLVGNVAIPAVNDANTADWVAEDGSLTEKDYGFTPAASLSPKTVGAYYNLSRRLLIQSSVDVEQLVRDELTQQLVHALDNAALASTNVVNAPISVFNITGITDSGNLDAGASPFSSILGEIAKFMDGNIIREGTDASGIGLVTNHNVYRRLATQFLTGTAVSQWALMRNEGISPLFSNIIPTTSSGENAKYLMGDFSEMFIGYWSGIDILVNPYADSVYAKGGLLVRAMMDADITVRRKSSIVQGQFTNLVA